MYPKILFFTCLLSLFCCSLFGQQPRLQGATLIVGNSQSSDNSTQLTQPQVNSTAVCASDEYYSHRIAQDPGLAQARTALDRQVYEAISSGAVSRSGAVLSIPTVVHIIHNNGPENISNTTVQNAISEINLALRNIGYYDPNTGVDTEIELCLANQDPSGNGSTGINRIVNGLTNMTLETQDLDLKNLSRWDPNLYLNIWVVNSITSQFSGPGVAGYSTFPTSHGQPDDGFVVEFPFFGGTQDDNKVSVHELGHYLGLYHTFQGGCSNNDCLQEGDRVCDTPPDASTARPPCTATPNTCNTDADDPSINNPFRPVASGGLGDQPDLFQAYMDYSDLACVNVYTDGQKERMRNFLQTTRLSLLQGNRCLPPCPQPVTANFTASATSVLFGQSVNFTNLSSGAALYTWKVNGTVFSTVPNPSYTFNSVGNQPVTLIVENSNPGCIDSFTVFIDVNCQAQASFSSPLGQLQPGQSVTFTNTSTNASNYFWRVDGVAAGTTANLNFTFPTAGIYQVELVATNGACNDTTTLGVQVGFCLDKSGLQWRFGRYSGLDFSSGSAVTTSSSMLQFENGATIADQNGDLLFYTNGGTVSTSPIYIGGIWNRNDSLMPNGTLSVSDYGCTSAMQSAIILPDPGNSDRYYVIVNSCNEDNYLPGLAYHIVDMTLDNGLGDVAVKNQFIRDNHNEAMAAVKHCNGTDYWIVTMNENTAAFEFFLLDANGVSTTPQVSYPLFVNQNLYRHIKFSPDGTKMAVSYYTYSSGFVYSVNLYDFDKATATLTYRDNLPMEVSFSGGFDFSSNSKYLFTWGTVFQPDSAKLYQYDTDAPVPSATGYLSTQPLPTIMAPIGTQLGPDGKIYTSFGNDNKLGIIDFPNQPQSTWQLNGLQLFPGIHSGYGFVNVPGNSLYDPTPQISGPNAICSGLQTTYNLSYDPCGTNGILWEYIGGGTLISSTDSTALIQFGPGGIDTLIATKLADCSSLSDTFLVTVGTGTPVDIGPDRYLCAGTTQLDAGPGYLLYTWSNGGANQVTTANSPGWYWVEVLDQASCVARDSIYLYPNPGPPMPDLGPDTTICGGSILLLDPGTQFISYLWQDNTTDTIHTVFQAGTYIVEVEGPCGEFGRDTVEVFPCVGLEEAVFFGNILVFPNPNSGNFWLEVEFKEPVQELELSLLNALGQEVWSEEVFIAGNRIGKEMMLSGISEGIYLFRLKTGDQTYTERLRVQ